MVYDHQAAADELLARGTDPRFAEVLVSGLWAWGTATLPAEERGRPARGPSFTHRAEVA